MFSMLASHIDFWFTMGSTYSYLSVMRLVQLERLTGVRFRWTIPPALLEMKHVPFADKPTKSAVSRAFLHRPKFNIGRGGCISPFSRGHLQAMPLITL